MIQLTVISVFLSLWLGLEGPPALNCFITNRGCRLWGVTFVWRCYIVRAVLELIPSVLLLFRFKLFLTLYSLHCISPVQLHAYIEYPSRRYILCYKHIDCHWVARIFLHFKTYFFSGLIEQVAQHITTLSESHTDSTFKLCPSHYRFSLFPLRPRPTSTRIFCLPCFFFHFLDHSRHYPICPFRA